MRLIKSSALVAALCVVASSSAFADEKDTAAACQSAATQVNTALSGAQTNDAARKEKNLGFQACNQGFYHVGMVHYAKAMELMGSKLAAN